MSNEEWGINKSPSVSEGVAEGRGSNIRLAIVRSFLYYR